MDLNKILNDIINTYGKNEGYNVPDISWSDENMIGRYGEYQYWNNRIIVSRLLNTDKVSEKAVASVIYHEYKHQLMKKHTKEFEKTMRLFDGYDKANKELESYFEELSEYPPAKTQNKKMENKSTLILRIRFDKNDEDSYWKALEYFDHRIVGCCDLDLPEEYEGKYEQVIFTIDANGHSFITGWARNVFLHAKPRHIDMKKYKYGEMDYHFKYKRNDGQILLPPGVLDLGTLDSMPQQYIQKGICKLEALGKEDAKNVIEAINLYDLDVHELGFDDNAIDCEAIAIETTDAKELIELAHKDDSAFRRLCILNKAVTLHPGYATMLERAMAKEACGLLDNAVVDVALALSYSPEMANAKFTDTWIKKFCTNCIGGHRLYIQDENQP